MVRNNCQGLVKNFYFKTTQSKFYFHLGCISHSIWYCNDGTFISKWIGKMFLACPKMKINMCVYLTPYFRDSVNVWKAFSSNRCWHYMVKCFFPNIPFMIWMMNWTVPPLKMLLKYKRPIQIIQEQIINLSCATTYSAPGIKEVTTIDREPNDRE